MLLGAASRILAAALCSGCALAAALLAGAEAPGGPAAAPPAAQHKAAPAPSLPRPLATVEAAGKDPPATAERPPGRWELRLMRVTAYCPCRRCCGVYADGVTASGVAVTDSRGAGRKLVAAPPELPFGTLVSVPGYNAGRPVAVLDRGGSITTGRLDVLMATHSEALAWGVRHLTCRIRAPND